MGQEVPDTQKTDEPEFIPGSRQMAQWTASGEVAKYYHPESAETAPAAEAALVSQKLQQKAKAALLSEKKPVRVKYRIKNKAGRPPPPPIPRAWPPPNGFLPPELRKKLMPNLVAAKPPTKSKKGKKPSPILGVVYHHHLVTDERGLEEIVREHPLSGHRNLI